MKYTYLLVNLFSVIVPVIFSFHPRLKFNNHFRAFFTANIISASCFIVWDTVFTAKGVWGFSNKYTLGATIFNLPIEEILFFFCIPFACIFTYHCLTKLYTIKWNPKIETVFILSLSFILLLIGFLNTDKDYTSVTFISTALLILLFKFGFKVEWFHKIMSVYIVLLLPFFIVNGILTGYGLTEPVVWYNNAENLSIRLLTIPIEDIIYGFELIIFTLFFYERFKLKVTRYTQSQLHEVSR